MRIINNNQSKIIITLAILTFCSFSCKKFVQIGAPSTQVVTESVFDDPNAATGALFSIYYGMQRECAPMSEKLGLLADELQTPSTDLNPYYQNAFDALNPAADIALWQDGYNYIYQANSIISGIKAGSGISPRIKNQLIGESEFLRAFWYFYLVNCYGDVPMPLTTDYKINSSLSRSPKKDVYKQIISDLKDAKNLLDSNYVDQSDTATSTDRVRPNKATASAFLARAYLFSGDYEDADAEASIVISNNQYNLLQDLNGVFLINSAETIWQLAMTTPEDYLSTNGYYFILQAAPYTNGLAQASTISPQLWNSFEQGDQRKINWIGSVTTTGPDTTYYFPYKYKNDSLPVTEYSMMLRLAEQYLIRAEARVLKSSPDIQGALADLNAVRNRAGLGNYGGATDNGSLLAAILHERQTELFTEWGHRWFDLIRTGNVDAVMSIVTPQKGGAWASYKALLPIPEAERQIDFNLTQNPGY